MINFNKVHKSFGNLDVLQNLELSISSGGIFAILGPNGSGKTTLIKCILGMVSPDKGQILIDGNDIANQWEYRNHINYLPQIATFPANLTVQEVISMVQDLRTKDSEAHSLIQLFELEPFLTKKLNTLSGGTKQKVNIVLTFMFDSLLIILDEPTTGLDPLSLVQLKEIIKLEKEKGKTILITTHIMNLAEEISDEIVFLLDGKIYFKGTIEKIKSETKESNLEKSIAKILGKNA